MTYGLLFWILVVVTIAFEFWARKYAPAPQPQPGRRPTIGSLLIFILIILLGLGTYGPALHR